ncbi:MAG: phenylalanine--tRNA ligase subunit alpha, partial [Bacteroidota bacterium]
MENLEELETSLLDRVAAAGDLDALESLRVEALGKKGEVTQRLKSLGSLSPEERKAAGQSLNRVKEAVSEAIEARRADLEERTLEARLATEAVDVTLPARPAEVGRIHPISQTVEELVAIFGEMGFSVAEGPHIEDDYYNFTALNIHEAHPARQEMDTFYMRPAADGSRKVLRTHTSPVQIRHMLAEKPPVRIIVPGRTFRADHDATHSPMFHQVEGLVIDKKSHMGHLKGTLTAFCRAFFGVDDLPLRFRPSYFPFTEPSAEVDIGCSREGGELKIGPGKDWLEILGSGMVHPKVLANCGI